jgi:hypothetical protein
MKKILLFAGAAALAVGMPAVAKPDKPDRGGGAQQAGHGGKAQRGNGGNASAGRVKVHKAASFKPQRAERKQFRSAERPLRTERKQLKAERRQVERSFRGRDDRVERVRFDRDRLRNGRDGDGHWFLAENGACPPGLARKNNGCLPPGQAKKVFAVGEQLRSEWYRDYNLPLGYRSLYYDTPEYYYRYDDNGYIYRVDRESNLVSGLIPLLGGGFGVGELLPAGYGVYNVPLQYRDIYYDSPDAYYRYGDNAIYQVDPQTQMIESVVALLTGSSLGVGQMLPAGYDAYNLPLQYRDQYYDTDDSLYRYADGNIYQVDPQTQIIQAVISALV